MPDFDPSANGHRSAGVDPPVEAPAHRGNGILMVAVVSATFGFLFLLGSAAGGGIGTLIGLKGEAVGAAFFTGAAAGGVAGVVVGVRLAGRFGGSTEAPGARRFGVVGGMLGLLGAVAVASLQTLPIIAIVLPGLGAWLGDRLALGRRRAQG